MNYLPPPGYVLEEAALVKLRETVSLARNEVHTHESLPHGMRLVGTTSVIDELSAIERYCNSTGISHCTRSRVIILEGMKSSTAKIRNYKRYIEIKQLSNQYDHI
jgi:hypothetical protein